MDLSLTLFSFAQSKLNNFCSMTCHFLFVSNDCCFHFYTNFFLYVKLVLQSYMCAHINAYLHSLLTQYNGKAGRWCVDLNSTHKRQSKAPDTSLMIRSKRMVYNLKHSLSSQFILPTILYGRLGCKVCLGLFAVKS